MMESSDPLQLECNVVLQFQEPEILETSVVDKVFDPHRELPKMCGGEARSGGIRPNSSHVEFLVDTIDSPVVAATKPTPAAPFSSPTEQQSNCPRYNRAIEIEDMIDDVGPIKEIKYIDQRLKQPAKSARHLLSQGHSSLSIYAGQNLPSWEIRGIESNQRAKNTDHESGPPSELVSFLSNDCPESIANQGKDSYEATTKIEVANQLFDGMPTKKTVKTLALIRIQSLRLMEDLLDKKNEVLGPVNSEEMKVILQPLEAMILEVEFEKMVDFVNNLVEFSLSTLKLNSTEILGLPIAPKMLVEMSGHDLSLGMSVFTDSNKWLYDFSEQRIFIFDAGIANTTDLKAVPIARCWVLGRLIFIFDPGGSCLQLVKLPGCELYHGAATVLPMGKENWY